jgi:diguanylate cyclase (GGDEF)-like protein
MSTDDARPRSSRERRGTRSGRGRSSGETTKFEISEIARVAHTGPRPQVPLFVVVNGVQRGRPFIVEGPAFSVGRGGDCDVALHGRGISRTHISVQWDPDLQRVTVEDTGSTNGVFLEGERIHRQHLHDGDVIYLGPETAIRLEFTPDTDAMLRVRQYENSIVDDLTGVHNRRYLMSSLEHEMAFSRRHGQNLCLLLVDIDHFKRVNDAHGHQVGDAVIQQVASLVAEGLRAEDSFARLGGEEFAVVTRGMDEESATQLAERLRARVETTEYSHTGVTLHCTVSIGGALMIRGAGEDGDGDVSAFIKVADECLYEAKNGGRNRSVIRRA